MPDGRGLVRGVSLAELLLADRDLLENIGLEELADHLLLPHHPLEGLGIHLVRLQHLEERLLAAGLGILLGQNLVEFLLREGDPGGLGRGRQQPALADLLGGLEDGRFQARRIPVDELKSRVPHGVQDDLGHVAGGDREFLGFIKNRVLVRVEQRQNGRQVLGQLIGRRALGELRSLGLAGGTGKSNDA